MEVAGKVALVTGAAKGKGKYIAEGLLQSKAKVCLTDASSEDLADLEKSLSAKYGTPNVLFVKCEVTDAKQLDDAFTAAKRHFGRVDILINATVFFDEHNIEKTIDVNLNGTIRATYAAMKHLGDKGEKCRGLVVNITATVGKRGSPFSPAYSAAQYGIWGLTRALGNDINFEEDGVKVIAITSGHVGDLEIQHILKHCKLPHRLTEFLKGGGPEQPLSAEVFSSVVLDTIAKAANGDCVIITNEGKPITVTFKEYNH